MREGRIDVVRVGHLPGHGEAVQRVRGVAVRVPPDERQQGGLCLLIGGFRYLGLRGADELPIRFSRGSVMTRTTAGPVPAAP